MKVWMVGYIPSVELSSFPIGILKLRYYNNRKVYKQKCMDTIANYFSDLSTSITMVNSKEKNKRPINATPIIPPESPNPVGEVVS